MLLNTCNRTCHFIRLYNNDWKAKTTTYQGRANNFRHLRLPITKTTTWRSVMWRHLLIIKIWRRILRWVALLVLWVLGAMIKPGRGVKLLTISRTEVNSVISFKKLPIWTKHNMTSYSQISLNTGTPQMVAVNLPLLNIKRCKTSSVTKFLKYYKQPQRHTHNHRRTKQTTAKKTSILSLYKRR